MKKIFLAIVFVSAFTLLSNTVSQALSLEAFSFSGHIYKKEYDRYGPGSPKIGDTFIGQLSYKYNPMLEPAHGFVYEPENFFYFLSANWDFGGSASHTWGYGPAGSDGDGNEMIFIGDEASFRSTFASDDVYIQIVETGGSVLISSDRHGTINGTMDNVYYSSIPMDSAPVPEPATMLLFGTGLISIVGARLRRKMK